MSRILLVDDEPNMLSALQRALRQSKLLAGRRLKPSPIRSTR
jgi:CheY-like chemotaxis protein